MFAPRPPVHRQPKRSPEAASLKWRHSCAAGGNPQERGAHAAGVDTWPCPAEGRDVCQPDSFKAADLGLHRDRL